MTQSRGVGHERPDLTILDKMPREKPTWAVHPEAVWLRFSATSSGVSTVINHISNIEIVRWIDRAAEMALQSAGWSYHDLLEIRSMFFVARHEIDYRSEALPDETFFIATWVRDIKRVKSWRDTLIWAVRDHVPEVVCTASTLWVHVDLDTRKPTRIPDDLSQALRPLHHDASPWRARA